MTAHSRGSGRAIAALLSISVAACGAPVRTATTQTVSANATPSDVYLTLSERRSHLQAELMLEFDGLEALGAEGSEQELKQAKDAIYESVDLESLRPLLSRANIQEQEALSAEERSKVFAVSLSPLFTPARVEVRDETVTDDRATLNVRGYFEEVLTGEPGWIAGTVTLVREDGGWKVDSEAFLDPGSGEDDVPSGDFEVGGGLPTTDERPVVTQPMDESFGGGWSFAIRGKGYVVRLNNIPLDPHAGDYALTLRPGISGDADPATLPFPVSVTFSSRSENGDTNRTWDEAVTGTLTIESVAGGLASGHFVFTAEPSFGEPVTVQGSFRNVRIPK